MPQWSFINIDAWLVFESILEARRPCFRWADEYQLFFVVDNHFETGKLTLLAGHNIEVCKKMALFQNLIILKIPDDDALSERQKLMVSIWEILWCCFAVFRR